MRAFKHISVQKERELLEIFPSAWNFEWQDDESFVKKSFSLWDQWLHEICDEPDSELWVVSAQEKHRREKLFCDLAINIVIEFDTFGLFFRQNKFKALKSKTRLIQDINNNRELNRPLFIPSLELIYAQGHDYTGHIYFKNKILAKPVISLIHKVGLKFVK